MIQLVRLNKELLKVKNDLEIEKEVNRKLQAKLDALEKKAKKVQDHE
jgi:hypothetical protein